MSEETKVFVVDWTLEGSWTCHSAKSHADAQSQFRAMMKARDNRYDPGR